MIKMHDLMLHKGELVEVVGIDRWKPEGEDWHVKVHIIAVDMDHPMNKLVDVSELEPVTPLAQVLYGT